MGKSSGKLPGFCLNRIRPHMRVPVQSKLDSLDTNKSLKNGSANKTNQDSCYEEANEEEEVEVKVEEGKKKVVSACGAAKPTGFVIGRKIMIVVDSSFEAEGALQWAFSHTVQNQDRVFLLHVIKSSRQVTSDGPTKETAPRAYQLVHSLMNKCQTKRPEVQMEVIVVEGKEKGQVIVEEARKKGVALLILGQKKQFMTWRLLMMWAGGRHRVVGGYGGVVEYCIQNADCMAIAVRRKSKKVGGYLITTKRQKDFWLLA